MDRRAPRHAPGPREPARAPAMPACPRREEAGHQGMPGDAGGEGHARGRREAAAECGRVELIYKARRAPALRTWQKKS